jgi:hypothetical protein
MVWHDWLALSFEKLNLTFVTRGRRERIERAQVPPLSRAWIPLARIKPVLSGFKFSDHRLDSADLVLAARPFLGGGSLTPARRALDNPMAMACLVERAPCFPSRM